MKFIFSIILYFYMLVVHSQTVQWATKGGGTASDLGKNVTADPAGNSYVTGTFQNVVTFGPYSLTGPSIPTNTFFAKYDALGNIQWLRQISGGQNSPAAVVYSTAQGCVYMAGKFTGTIVLGFTSITSYGNTDCFFAKYDLNGNCLWAVNAGSINGEWVDDIDCDVSGNLVATGMVWPNGIFGGFIAPVFNLYETFTTSISPTGTFQWLTISCHANGSTVAAPYTSIKTDIYSNIFVTGLFNSSCTFGSQVYTAGGLPGNINIFIQKLSPTGVILWTNIISSSTNNESTSIATDASGNVYVAGNFRGTVDFGGIIKTGAGPVSNYDVFVAKYDPIGTLVWVQQYGSVNNDYGKSVEVLSNGNIVLAGYYTINSQFGSYTLMSAGNNDGYVALLDPSGNTNWACSFGGTASDVVMCAVPDNNGNLYCTGYFTGLASNYGIYSLAATGSSDVSIFKITIPGPLPVELVSFSVEPVSQNIAALCKWATASEKLNNYFTIEKSNDGKSFLPIAKINGAGNSSIIHSYDFIDYDPFPGISYYRLTQTDDNGNSQILKTVSFRITNNNISSVQCYPTIGNGDFTIHSDKSISEIKMTDIHGSLIKDYFYSTINKSIVLQLNDLEKGMYFLQFNPKDENNIVKVVIE